MIEQIRKDFGSQGQTYATNKDQGIIPVSAQISSNIWANYYYDTDSKEDFTDMKRRMLFQTNEYRKLHKVPELTLDSTLANEAQNYANYIAKINRLEHDPKNKQNGWGENLAMGSSSVAYLAVKWWYDEIKKYDFNKPGYQAGTGHFTQLVWKGTSKAGFGVAANGGIVYIVCKYSPPGNYLNLFSENVFRPVRQ
ncbi:CAP domain-containing protein [Strongyloides ratti]|nr:CAP domain-containing protein [Strongyloides ratti]CEF61330.1 CAP domain-containing protein [Strongyloides ratti]